MNNSFSDLASDFFGDTNNNYAMITLSM